jgi:hypothetical protein
MKRYEDFNKRFKTNDEAAVQAMQMIIGEIAEHFQIRESELQCYEKKFKDQITWLNEDIDLENLDDSEIKTFQAPQYLIICLRNGYWERYDDLVFWGKNHSGYEFDIRKAGFYTKEEALKICDCGDVSINVNKINIPKETFNIESKDLAIKINKTDDICDYVNKFIKIQKNKQLMKYGE